MATPPPNLPLEPAPAQEINTMPQPSAASPSSREPEDIFSDLDRSARGMAKRASVPTAGIEHASESSFAKYLGITLIVFLLLGGAGAGFWYVFIRSAAPTPAPVTTPAPTPTPSPPAPEPIPTSPLGTEVPVTPTPIDTTPTSVSDTAPVPETPLPSPVTAPPSGVNIPPPTAPVPEPEVKPDTDRDGLVDQRESELGLDPRKADTDGDTLSDGDEVLVYGTNPLNTDTDGDTYPDGVEIQKGYNPRGEGKCQTADCRLTP